MQRMVVYPYRRFGTTYWSHPQGWPIGCDELSVRNYHYSRSNNPEERSSQLLRGGGLISWKITILQCSFCRKDSGFRTFYLHGGRLLLKCDGTRAETRFRLSAKRTSQFKSAWVRQFSRLLTAEVCASAVVMLDTPCSEVVWRVLATHCIRQFPLHFPFRASPCAITFQLDSTSFLKS
jgi:hypothetical protein